jgi:hypothetical protein
MTENLKMRVGLNLGLGPLGPDAPRPLLTGPLCPEDAGEEEATERYQLMSIVCDGLDTRYQGKFYLPFECGNIEKPLHLVARLVCCVTRTL